MRAPLCGKEGASFDRIAEQIEAAHSLDQEIASFLHEAAWNVGRTSVLNAFEPDQLTRLAEAELRLIEPVLSELTRLPSRWNGSVELRLEAQYRGAKPRHCEVLLDRKRQEEAARWRTHIHELLHAHSAGFTGSEFEQLPGWEEGVVEKLQRLLRPRILERIGVVVPEQLFAEEESAHPYNPYLEALDSLYRFVANASEHEQEFYCALLARPILKRPSLVVERAERRPPERWADFLRALGRANAVLRETIRAR